MNYIPISGLWLLIFLGCLASITRRGRRLVRPEGDFAKAAIQSLRDWDATLKAVGFQLVNYSPPEPETRSSGIATRMKNDRVMDKAYPEIKNFTEHGASAQPM